MGNDEHIQLRWHSLTAETPAAADLSSLISSPVRKVTGAQFAMGRPGRRLKAFELMRGSRRVLADLPSSINSVGSTAIFCRGILRRDLRSSHPGTPETEKSGGKTTSRKTDKECNGIVSSVRDRPLGRYTYSSPYLFSTDSHLIIPPWHRDIATEMDVNLRQSKNGDRIHYRISNSTSPNNQNVSHCAKMTKLNQISDDWVQ